jgi:carboxylesterase type B
MDRPFIENVLNGLSEEKISSIYPNQAYHCNEFECLNLNITTPAGALHTTLLPVLICLHGGGHIAGHNSAWFNDGGPLVSRSVEISRPIVVVSTK